VVECFVAVAVDHDYFVGAHRLYATMRLEVEEPQTPKKLQPAPNVSAAFASRSLVQH